MVLGASGLNLGDSYGQTALDEVRQMAIDGGVLPGYQVEEQKALCVGITLSIVERKWLIRLLIGEALIADIEERLRPLERAQEEKLYGLYP